MCTLIVATRVWRSVPLLVAANRDEKLTRPAEKPSLREEGGVRILAPKDLDEGGTWLGVNASGRVRGVDQPVRPAPRRPTLAGQARAGRIEGHEPGAGPQPRQRPRPRAAQPLPPRSGGRRGRAPRVERRREAAARAAGARCARGDRAQHETRHRPSASTCCTRRLQDIFKSRPPSPDEWQDVLSTKADESLEGINVLDERRGYGTRSSSILYMASTPGNHRFMHAEGPPDKTPYEDNERAAADATRLNLTVERSPPGRPRRRPARCRRSM